MCCCECLSDICLIVVSVFFPPLPVWIRRGLCTCDSLINILLCMLGYFPGLIHSWYIIAKYPPYAIRHESKVYYVYQTRADLENQYGEGTSRTSRDSRNPLHHHHHHHHHHREPVDNEPLPIANPTYGSTSDRNDRNETSPPAYTEIGK
ncbi:unnamed protein product [Debaryomyces tyrocola]|nr:unnamed protein product [Debaryomyces tyrocola]